MPVNFVHSKASIMFDQYLAFKTDQTIVRVAFEPRCKFCSDLWNSGAGISIWPCHPSLLLFMGPTEDCLCFVFRPSGCSAAQPWLIQVGLRGEQPGRVTPPGIWCLAAIKPVELCRAESRGWNWQPLDTCSKNRTTLVVDSIDVKANAQRVFVLISSFPVGLITPCVSRMWAYLGNFSRLCT